jgi:phospholipid-binding lipoprotein MlaA
MRQKSNSRGGTQLLTWQVMIDAVLRAWAAVGKTLAPRPNRRVEMKKGMRCARGWAGVAIACVLPLILGACAGLPRDASLPINDPSEEVNRHVMAANQEVLRPASEFVKAAIPGPVHDRLHDLNSNLREPRIFVNNVLQGRFEAAGRTGVRFAMNSIFGLGGLVDVASREGLEQQSGDFGQTLFVWGVAEGPYVVRPYLGPATLRDAVGSTVDMFSNPIGWFLGPQMAISVGSAGVDAADRLGQFKMAEDASIDFYSFIRSSYYQMRRAELREAIGLPTVVESPATADLEDPEPEASRPAAVVSAPQPSRSAAAPKPSRSAAAPKPSRSAAAPKPSRTASAPDTTRSASAAQ